jgi:ubiquinone/menaquinone biosynthesis C-methylase UbiE
MSTGSAWLQYDHIPEDYDRIAGPHFFEPVAAHLVSLLPLDVGQHVLDVACGTGIVGDAAMRRVDGLRVVGVDLSMPMIRSARKRGLQGLITASALALPFADCSFEHLTASFLMNHLADPVSAATGMMRVLRANGTIGISSWSIGPSENDVGAAWREMAGNYLPKEAFDRASRQSLPSEEAFRDRRMLEELLRTTGFRAQRSETVRFEVEISTRDYVVTRHISLPARFMRDTLEPQKWQEFQRSVLSTLVKRFGSSVRFQTAANFAIGKRA